MRKPPCAMQPFDGSQPRSRTPLHERRRTLAVCTDNGLQYSNSLFFEVARGWDCLLVEANPALQADILALNRRCTLLKGGLSTSPHPAAFNFTMAGALGGIVDSMSAKERAHAARAVQQQRGFARGAAGTGATMVVRCYPLHEVLLQGRVRRAGGAGVVTVDYWSLDTEGSEPDILNATDFGAVEVLASSGASNHMTSLPRHVLGLHLHGCAHAGGPAHGGAQWTGRNPPPDQARA